MKNKKKNWFNFRLNLYIFDNIIIWSNKNKYLITLPINIYFLFTPPNQIGLCKSLISNLLRYSGIKYDCLQ